MTFVLRAGLVIGAIFYLSPLRPSAPSLPSVAEPLRELALRAGTAEAGRAAEASLRGTLGLDARPAPHPETTAAIR